MVCLIDPVGFGNLLISEILGPFASESDFNVALQNIYTSNAPLPSLFRFNKELEPHRHDIVFAHGRLSFRSIMIQDGHISSIMEWEYAGWLPSYWDWICALDCPRDSDLPYWRMFWEMAMEPPHPDVLAATETLERALWTKLVGVV